MGLENVLTHYLTAPEKQLLFWQNEVFGDFNDRNLMNSLLIKSIVIILCTSLVSFNKE
jgi:hypothetical protein